MSRKSSLYRWSLAIALVAATGVVAAPGPYALTALGEPPGDSDRAEQAYAINSQGVVAGEFRTTAGRRASSPFISFAGEFRSLGTPLGRVRAGARGINDLGQVVGETDSLTSRSRAFLWKHKRYIDLGTVGGTWARARAINNAGTIVGWSGTPERDGHAFVYRNGSMQDIHPFGRYSDATAISPNGTIVGNWWPGDTLLYGAFIYRDGQARDLDPLHQPIYVYGVNDAGQVVGAGPESRAALWQDGVMHDLGTLGGGLSEALAINATGQIVGHAMAAGDRGWQAFIYDEGRMWSLTKLVARGGEGWRLQTARAINDRGQIVGIGLHEGEPQSFLLTPLPGGGPH